MLLPLKTAIEYTMLTTKSQRIDLTSMLRLASADCLLYLRTVAGTLRLMRLYGLEMYQDFGNLCTT